MGQDFTLSKTEVTFELGDHNGNGITTRVTVVDDLLMEGTENIILHASAPSPASFVGDPVTINILDDDSKCVSSLSLAQ